jgi:hypothetical protein
MQRHISDLIASLLIALTCFSATPATALDGSNDVFVTIPDGPPSGWKTFEILSGYDTLGPLAKENFEWDSGKHDYWDGLGAYLHDSSTLRTFVNHETGAGVTFSRVDLNLANLQAWIIAGNPNNSNSNQVAAPGPIVTAVSKGWTSVGSGTNPLHNPCSANVWLADTFGPDRGFADTLFLTAEENSSGHIWVLDTATRTLYEAVGLGTGSWENATPIDPGRTDTIALLLSEDQGASSSGTAPLRLYVGLKNPAGNFLQRNGLSGGTVYHWDPAGGSTTGTTSGIFSAGNGTVASGTWVTSGSNAAKFSKLEDLHTNMNPSSPGFGLQVAIAAQDEGIFEIDCTQLDFVAGNLGVNRNSDVLLLFEADSDVSGTFDGMDNLVWSPDGLIYVNEDAGDGDIWVVDPDSLKASYALNDFTPSAAQVFDILDGDNTSSGIIDISEHVGYQPGSVFFTSSQSGSLSECQIAMMVSPTAALIQYNLNYSAGTGGSLSGNTAQVVGHGNDGTPVTAVPATGYGFVDWSDGVLTAARTDTNITAEITAVANFQITSHYLVWISGFPSISGADALPMADPDHDGSPNLKEYAFNLNPTLNDATIIPAGSGIAGLPLIEVRDFEPGKRLVIEYIRRLIVTDLTTTPQFSSDLSNTGPPAGWGPGATETVSPINSNFERVVIKDIIDTSANSNRFGRLKIDLTPAP